MRTVRRTFLLLLIIGAAGLGPAHAVWAQTPTDTAETPDVTPTPTPEPAEDADADTDADDDAAAEDDDDLPTTGAPIWLYGMIGVNVLQLGWGLLLVEDRLRRGPQGRRRRRRSPFRR